MFELHWKSARMQVGPSLRDHFWVEGKEVGQAESNLMPRPQETKEVFRSASLELLILCDSLQVIVVLCGTI